MLNAGATFLHRLGLPFGQLAEASLLAGARKATGLEDWGGEHFLEPLRVMIDDVENSNLTSLARISTRDIGIHCLSNRLRLTDYFKTHPHVAQHEINRPVFLEPVRLYSKIYYRWIRRAEPCHSGKS